MPTVLRHKGYRFFFYSNEGDEPSHIHVRKGDSEAKVWLHDLSVAVNLGYTPRELNEIMRIVRAEQARLREAWDGFFGYLH
jgi:hypothetical protein